MKVMFFSTQKYELPMFQEAQKNSGIEFTFLEARLKKATAGLATGHDGVCCFVNDVLSKEVLQQLKDQGIKFVALRCAGFNNVDLAAAKELGIRIVRVPEYSPHAVAEHAVALLLTLVRKTHRSHNRIRDLNFSLEGLMGFDLYQKTVGVVGAGRIGRVFIAIMKGFGCRILVADPYPDKELAKIVEYVSNEDLYRQSDIISLHCPLTDKTRHLLNKDAFAMMKENVIIVNTGRGALIDTHELIEALKTRRIAGACLDVYEEEEGIFFTDQSDEGIRDDMLARLTTFPNVILTSHQAFLTHEALDNIAKVTIQNLQCLHKGSDCQNEVQLRP